MKGKIDFLRPIILHNYNKRSLKSKVTLKLKFKTLWQSLFKLSYDLTQASRNVLLSFQSANYTYRTLILDFQVSSIIHLQITILMIFLTTRKKGDRYNCSSLTRLSWFVQIRTTIAHVLNIFHEVK